MTRVGGIYLALDGGGTSTRAGLYDADGTLRAEAAGGPSNPVAYGLDAGIGVLAALGRSLLDDDASRAVVAVGLAGVREEEMRAAVAKGLAEALGASRVLVTDDIRPVLFANAGTSPAVLVNAGTGSSVLGQSADGRTAFVGGRGALLGDDGSAYRVAVEALRAAAHAADELGPNTRLLETLPQAAGAEDLDRVSSWAESADKQRVANLAAAVVTAAEEGDAVALDVLRAQADALALQAAAAYQRLDLPPGTHVFLHGGLLAGAPLYRRLFIEALEKRIPGARPESPSLTGHAAVFRVARADKLSPTLLIAEASAGGAGTVLPPTERASQDRPHLDSLDAEGIARLMNREDARIAAAVEAALPAVARTMEAGAKCLRAGGRIVYVGAGTSGRLGVLDASECPPTFGVAPDRVVARMAGGDAALLSGIEGAEDDREQGRADVADAGPDDLVVGIAASGTTPYVRAALEAAAERGAATALLCCNPAVRDGADIVIVLDTGPEVLPGSTRLKAGTATKMVLNMISTGAMALSGRVYAGYMVGMRPVNAKLRRRAARIVSALTEKGEDEAFRLLDEADGQIPVAVLMGRLGLDVSAAERRLKEAGGVLRDALA